MDIRAFICHKKAEKYCDCQDCFGISTQSNRIAVSDGMSQSVFSQWWAKILVDAFLEKGEIPNDTILPYQEKWQNMVENEIQRQESEGANPWLLKNMFAERLGAGATLCGFQWSNGGWTCKCLGDTCLIKVKSDYSIEIITSQQGNFNNHPDYLDSFGAGRGNPCTAEGDFNLEAILIVTDPFAELFQHHQKNTEFIKERMCEIGRLNNHESYINLVERWRDDFNMHNDDSTLVILNKFEDKEVTIIHEDSIDKLLDNGKSNSENSECFFYSSNNDCLQIIQEGEAEAKEAFINAFCKLLKFYNGNRSIGKVMDWIKPIIRNRINPFCKK